MAAYGAMQRDFQSFAGPGDKDLPMSEISGYQPPSRIGEVVMNAFIDSYEFATMEDALSATQMAGTTQSAAATVGQVEFKPHFHEWATVTAGMICLARKKKTAVFRQYVAAETAVPVISCAACLPKNREKDYFFAGVARTKSIRGPDDGIGPSVDEFFTLSIGGMVTVLNTSGGNLHPGDLIEWCFLSPKAANYADASGIAQPVQKRLKTGPRRFGIKMATVSSSKVIGRALSFSKPGETLDILLRQ